jgi:MtaA/CmuA family methyltransferase
MMDTRERFLNAMTGSETDRMPAACPLQTGTLDLMRLSGAYWPDAHRDAKKMALLSLAASTYAGVESARLPFDVVVDAEAFGAKIGYGNQVSAPFVVDSPISSLDDIRQLDVPEVRDAGRVPVVDEAIAIVRRMRPDLPIVVTVHAPFTLSLQLRGEENAMIDLASQPERYRDLVDFIARWSSFVAVHFIESGADTVMMVDGEADDSILGPELYESFALPGQRKVAEAIRAAGAPSLLHICGDIRLCTDMMVRSGVDAISIGQGMRIPMVKEIVKDRCRVIGNIDPTGVLLGGTPKQVEADVRRCAKEGVDIVAPGCGLSPKTPLENLKAMTDAVRKYGRKIK